MRGIFLSVFLFVLLIVFVVTVLFFFLLILLVLLLFLVFFHYLTLPFFEYCVSLFWKIYIALKNFPFGLILAKVYDKIYSIKFPGEKKCLNIKN